MSTQGRVCLQLRHPVAIFHSRKRMQQEWMSWAVLPTPSPPEVSQPSPRWSTGPLRLWLPSFCFPDCLQTLQSSLGPKLRPCPFLCRLEGQPEWGAAEAKLHHLPALVFSLQLLRTHRQREPPGGLRVPRGGPGRRQRGQLPY